jgi:hypothetical protein
MATVNSLRKKTKGVQSLPRRQSVYHGIAEGSSQPLPPPPRVRPKDKSKVESLMKRRYSTRGVPQNLNLEPFPAELSVKSRTTDSNFSDNVKLPLLKMFVLNSFAERSWRTSQVGQLGIDESGIQTRNVHCLIVGRSIRRRCPSLLRITPRSPLKQRSRPPSKRLQQLRIFCLPLPRNIKPNFRPFLPIHPSNPILNPHPITLLIRPKRH